MKQPVMSSSDWIATNRSGSGGECLHCHNTKYMQGGTAPTYGGRADKYAVDDFPMTGHKNVMRKVSHDRPYGGPFFSAGEPGSTAYTTNLAGADYIYNSWFVDINEAEARKASDV